MTGRDERQQPDAESQDAAFAAVVRSDPAGASVPDPARLWPLVLARTQDDGAGAYGSAAQGDAVRDGAAGAAGGAAVRGAQVLAIAGARRRRSGLLRVAAAAAAVVVVGSGGFALGANRAQAPADRVVTADQPTSYGAEGVWPDEEVAATERLRFVAEGLLAGPERASVWVLDPSVDPSTRASMADEPAASDQDAADEELFEEEGSLSRGVLVGELPLVSVEDAVERLGDPLYQVNFLPGAPFEGPAGAPAVEEPGHRVPWPVVEVRITSAVLTSEVVPAGDGRDWVLPVFELSDGRDNVWRVLALQDDALDTSPG